LRIDLIQRLEEPSLSLAPAVRRRLLTFEAPAQNSLALGFLLSLSAVEYLTLEERKAIVDPISAALRDKRVAHFMSGRSGRGRETDSVGVCAQNA